MKSKNIKMCTQENCSHFSLVASIAVPERATIKLFWSASNSIIGLVCSVALQVLHGSIGDSSPSSPLLCV